MSTQENPDSKELPQQSLQKTPQCDPFENPNTPQIIAIDLSEPQQTTQQDPKTNSPDLYAPPISQNYQAKQDPMQQNALAPTQHQNNAEGYPIPEYQPYPDPNQQINHPQFPNNQGPVYNPAHENPNFQQQFLGQPSNYSPRPSYSTQNRGSLQFPNSQNQNFQNPQFQK